MSARTDTAVDVARLAAWALAVSLVVTRLGLLAHELIGHGGAALAVGGHVVDLRLYAVGGGWIEYGGWAAWSSAAVGVVSLAGIAVELAVAAMLGASARRRRAGPGATALAGAAWGLAVHAGVYLVVGLADGVGDGAWAYRRLGGLHVAAAVAIAVATAAAAAVAAGRLGRQLAAMTRATTRGRRAAVVAAALALAGGAHAGLVVAELALRRDATYAAVMAPERTRAIERELAAWRARAAQAGPVTPAAEGAARRAIARAHPDRRLGPALVGLVVVAGLAGLGRALTSAGGPPRPLPRGAALGAVAAAAAAISLVIVIDVVGRALTGS
ncbi:MAG: hypothetical protein R3B06_04975 [Kofleriaceae bacterium]